MCVFGFAWAALNIYVYSSCQHLFKFIMTCRSSFLPAQLVAAMKSQWLIGAAHQWHLSSVFGHYLLCKYVFELWISDFEYV